MDDATIAQVLVYKALSESKNDRFMLVAQQIEQIYEKVLDEYGIPYKIISKV